MTRERKSDLVFGILLFIIGAWFLAAEFSILPGLNELMNIQYQWPFIVIGVGVFLFLMGLLLRAPGMLVPACVVGGIGGILYWNNYTQDWGAWSYLWTLIPGFVGIGTILSTLLGGEEKKKYLDSLRLILVSAVLFVIFLIFFSGGGTLIRYWPIIVILAGFWVIIRTILSKR